MLTKVILKPGSQTGKQKQNGLWRFKRRTLSAPPALLASINIGKKNFVLKELQPSADRIDYTLFKGNTKKLKNILEDMAAICAWSNLRGTGRDGSAIADTLIGFAKERVKMKKLLTEYSARLCRLLTNITKTIVMPTIRGSLKLGRNNLADLNTHHTNIVRLGIVGFPGFNGAI